MKDGTVLTAGTKLLRPSTQRDPRRIHQSAYTAPLPGVSSTH